MVMIYVLLRPRCGAGETASTAVTIIAAPMPTAFKNCIATGKLVPNF